MGRLSPIQAILGIEPDWAYGSQDDFTGSSGALNQTSASDGTGALSSGNATSNPSTITSEAQAALDEVSDALDEANLSALDALAGALADDLTLRTEFLKGSVFIQHRRPMDYQKQIISF